MLVLLNFLSEKDENLQKVNNAFNLLDEDATGFVDLEKLKKIIPDIKVESDKSDNFKMQYTDFLTHAIDIKN